MVRVTEKLRTALLMGKRILRKAILVYSNRSAALLLKFTKRVVRGWARLGVIIYRFTHRQLADKPHAHLMNRWRWYSKWHGWNYHKHVHSLVLTAYVLTVGVITLAAYHRVFAADLVDTWNFATPANFTLDSGVETSGTSVTMKAANYVSDADTAALYHLDEPSGTTASDSSANSNTATVNGTPNWVTGNLNNGFSLNSTTNISAPDSGSLSLSQTNSLEAWTKFNSAFSAGSHDRNQTVLDKGSYQLYYDKDTGKVTYELANSAATNWTQKAGSDINGSWDLDGKLSVNAQVAVGSDIYAGLGDGVGDTEVWKWNGSTWTKVGGDGVNSGWADQTFENVLSLNKIGTTLYAGLGSDTGEAEVWSCDTSTNCTNWTKIGGEATNSSWAADTFEEVDSMTVLGTDLYVGLGTTTDDAQVWKWNGTTWTWVGGFGIGGPYNAFSAGYEAAYSLSNDGTNVYAGLGGDTGDGDVWKLSGTTWTQIGGDGLNSGWAGGSYESVASLNYLSGTLYAGTGTGAGDAEVWSWNGSAWTQVGGDNNNSSWDATSYETVYSFANDGTNLYAGLGNTAGDNEVWEFSGGSWTKIGGDGLNSGFTSTHLSVRSLAYAGSTLYAGLQASLANAEVWSFNGSSWTRIGGGYVNHSWGYFGLQDVETMTTSGGYLYAATGSAVAGNALVWKFDGSTWQLVGGQGINSSWAVNTYEKVASMTSFGGNLFVGLGISSGDAEVWEFNGSSWTQVGGDGLNSGWGAGYEEVDSMTVLGGNLYAGLGTSASDAEVWIWNGSSWSKIGGDSLNSSWGAGYERVTALSVYNGQIYAGLGVSTNDAALWTWNGSSWIKVGGNGLNGSWNTVYERVESLTQFNDKLYVGLGSSTGDAEIWEYNGTSWAMIGGDAVNSSWANSQFEQARSLASYNGELYVGLGNSAGDGQVWKYDGTNWSMIGGSSINSSWSGAIETVQALSTYKGKLYAATGNTTNADAQVWAYGDNGFLQSSTTSQDTNWHHLAATYDGTTMKLYIDGALDTSLAKALTMPDNSQPLMIGASLGASNAGWAQGSFDGTLDEIRISDIARSTFTSHPYSTTAQKVTLNTAARQSGVWHWDTYSDNETPNGGTITFRLSDDDGTTWKYWDGSGWVASASTAQANSVAVINTNIATFPVTFSGIKWQAILLSNGDQRVTLDDITLQSTSDTTAPSVAGVTITAKKANGGSDLNQNDWTNGGSPYFSWNSTTDTQSGIKGYCAYIGTDNTADPVLTKGSLGTSPAATGGHCQFIVDAANLDLGVAGMLDPGSPLVTSNSPYYLTLKAIDNAGNVSSDTTQFYFRFDNTPPDNPAFITAPSTFVNHKDVDLTWSTSDSNAAADANSGVIGLQYRIGASTPWYGDLHSGSGDINDLLANDGLYTTQDPPDFDNLAEGSNTVYFRTWDQAGNVSPTYVTTAIKINTSGTPSAPQNLVATPNTNTTNDFAFSWDAPATFVGDASGLSYCYTVNTLPSPTTCTFTSPGVTSVPNSAYATQPGANTFYVVARDESTNIDYASYASVSFNANTTAPGMPLNLDVADVSIRSTSSWRLAPTWDPPTNPGSGIASYKVYRSTDNVTYSLIGSTTSTTYVDTGLSQQLYYYKVKACDNTNNCGAFSSAASKTPSGRFTSPAILVANPVVSSVTTRQATISWSTDRDSDSKIAFGTSSGNYSPSEVGNSDQVTAHQVTLENLSAGTTYYFIAKWTDSDGNTGQSAEFSFTTAPAPTFKQIVSFKIGLTSSSISFTSKNATRVSVLYGTSESFGGIKTINTSTSESTYTIDLSSLQDGTTYFFKLVAYDSENTAYESSVFTFTTPPRPKISHLAFQPVAGEPTSTQRVSWTTNVPATSTIIYGKVGSAGTEISTSQLVTKHEITIRDLEDDSEYFLVAQSRDGAGNLAVSDRQQFHTALDTRPPHVSEISIESSIRGTGADARGQVIVSWRTDELATSQVAFAEGSAITSFNNRTAEDTGLSFEHIVIVSDLPTSKVYTVEPISRDKTGNAGNGTPQPAIIGRASDSVLTIVLETLKKIFGF